MQFSLLSYQNKFWLGKLWHLPLFHTKPSFCNLKLHPTIFIKKRFFFFLYQQKRFGTKQYYKIWQRDEKFYFSLFSYNYKMNRVITIILNPQSVPMLVALSKIKWKYLKSSTSYSIPQYKVKVYQDPSKGIADCVITTLL